MTYILPSHLESFGQLHDLLKLLNAEGVVEFLPELELTWSGPDETPGLSLVSPTTREHFTLERGGFQGTGGFFPNEAMSLVMMLFTVHQTENAPQEVQKMLDWTKDYGFEINVSPFFYPSRKISDGYRVVHVQGEKIKLWMVLSDYDGQDGSWAMRLSTLAGTQVAQLRNEA